MVWTLHSKLSTFCCYKFKSFKSLNPFDILGIYIELIFIRGFVFLNDHNNIVIFPRYICSVILSANYLAAPEKFRSHIV